MSSKLMVKAMRIKVGNPISKLVLIKLAENAKDDGKCWPSYQHIATYCECSKVSARRHIANLEKLGLLKKETRTGYQSGRANASNVYYLNLEATDELKAGETVNQIPELHDDEHVSLNNEKQRSDLPEPMLTESTGDQIEHSPLCSQRAHPMLRQSTPYAQTEHTLCSQRAPEPIREPVIEPVNKTHSQLGLTTPRAKPEKRKPNPLDCEAYLNAYNEIVGDRLPHAVEASNERKRKLKILVESLVKPNLEGFQDYVNAFMQRARPFHFGDNDRGWVATFDYLLNRKTLTKIREGTL